MFTYNDVILQSNVGFDDPALGQARRDTVKAVTDYINTVVDANGRIDVFVQSSQMDGFGPLATMATSFGSTPAGFSPGRPFEHAQSGVDPNGPSNPDCTLTVDFGYNWNSETDAPLGFEVDLFSVLLHEFTHAIGINGLLGANGQNSFGQDPGAYSTFESQFRNGNTNTAQSLFAAGGDFVGNTADLIQPVIFFWGPSAIATNGGKPVRVFTTNPFSASALRHVAAQSVMVPSASAGTVVRTYSSIDRAILRDIGWTLKPRPSLLGPTKFALFADGFGGPLPPVDEEGEPVLLPIGSRQSGAHVGSGGVAYDRAPSASPPVVDSRELPGMLALTPATDGTLNWVSPRLDLRTPLGDGNLLRHTFRLNPASDMANPASFVDIVVGAESATTDGADSAAGIGLRFHLRGPNAGVLELRDGTNGNTVLVQTYRFGGPAGGSALPLGRFMTVQVELIAPTFAPGVPERVKVSVDGVPLPEFRTAGGLPAHRIFFYAGPALPTAPAGQLLLDDLLVETDAAPEPATTPTPRPTATVAPTAPCGTSTQGSFRTVTWAEPTSANIYRRGLPGGSFVPVATDVPPPLANVYLPAGASQQEIDVRGPSGQSLVGYPVLVQTGSGICGVDAPASALPLEVVTLNWQGPSGMPFRVYRRGLPNGQYIQLTPAGGAVPPVNVTMPAALTSQEFRITDFATGAETATVVVPVIAPGLTLNLAGTTTSPVAPGSAFTLAWSTNAPAGTTWIVQRRGLPNGTWVNVAPVASTTANTLTFVLPNSTIDQEIRVRTSYVPGASLLLQVTVGNAGPG